jgi:hypothetical protein
MLMLLVSRSSPPLDVIARATSCGMAGASLPVRLDTEKADVVSAVCV